MQIIVSAAALLACGEATCPKGSSSINGDCVPLEQMCADGEQLVDGQCATMNPIGEDGTSGSDIGQDPAMTRPVDAGWAGAPPSAACAAIDCGAHGRCDEALAACVCDGGWMGEHCDQCPADMVPSADGACVPLCDSMAAPECSEHGACVVAGGAAICECERGFAGELCDECAELFRMEDDGTCVADCGDCGTHASCDDSGELPACVCVPGYSDDGDGCKWVGDGENGGGLIDGELDDPTAWQTRHVAIDRGAATFANAIVDGKCQLGWLSQEFAMPTLEQAEPFALDLVVTTTCTSNEPSQCPPLLVETGDAVARVQVPGGNAGTTRTVSVCLGDAAYGENVTLRIRPGLATAPGITDPFDCETVAWPKIEAIGIRTATASECALDDGVPGFDATEGWTLRSAAISDGELQFESNGTAMTRIVVPSADRVASPALHIDVGGEPVRIEVRLGGLVWSGLSGVLCLPDWSQGLGHDLELRSAVAQSIGDVTIETDAKCGDGRLDAGFEREIEDVYVGGHGSWEATGGRPTVTRDAAHTGSLGVRVPSQINVMRALMRIPISTGASRAAFSLQHRINGSAQSSAIAIEPFGVLTNPTGSGQWAPHVTCLEPKWEGQLVLAGILLSGTGDQVTFDIDEVGPALTDVCE